MLWFPLPPWSLWCCPGPPPAKWVCLVYYPGLAGCKESSQSLFTISLQPGEMCWKETAVKEIPRLFSFFFLQWNLLCNIFKRTVCYCFSPSRLWGPHFKMSAVFILNIEHPGYLMDVLSAVFLWAPGATTSDTHWYTHFSFKKAYYSVFLMKSIILNIIMSIRYLTSRKHSQSVLLLISVLWFHHGICRVCNLLCPLSLTHLWVRLLRGTPGPSAFPGHCPSSR